MKRLLAILGLVALSAGAARAQETSGTIVGTITDEAGGAPVSGADVWIEGTRFHAVSRDDGRFVLAGVTPGVYTVRVFRIGYGAEFWRGPQRCLPGQPFSASEVVERVTHAWRDGEVRTHSYSARLTAAGLEFAPVLGDCQSLLRTLVDGDEGGTPAPHITVGNTAQRVIKLNRGSG